MKFEELYKNVFITEQSKKDVNTEVADPSDFNDVEPMPLPKPIEQPIGDVSSEPALGETGVESSSTLADYINKIEDFANQLNGTEGSSLQALVSKLDRVESPFEGIYARTSAEIVDAAKTLRSVSEKLKNFIIHAAKK